MAEQNKPGSEDQSRRGTRPKNKKPIVVAERSSTQAGLAQLSPEPIDATIADDQTVLQTLLHGPNGALGGGSIENQSALLNNPHLKTVQRQALVTEIGRMQGNRHLQRVMASLKGNGDGNGHKSSVVQSQSSGPQKGGNGSHAATAEKTGPAEPVLDEAGDEGLASSGPPTLATAEPPPDESRSGTKILPKLTVGRPDDRYEQEADQVAGAVMRMPVEDAPEGEGEKPTEIRPLRISRIQPNRDVDGTEIPDDASSNVESQIEGMKGMGRPLPPEERTFFEDRMGVDFGDVRIHTGGAAVQTSQDLSARAYTIGSDVAFNAGEYAPGTTEGRRLLAHELTHIVQQGAAGESVSRRVEEPERASEPDQRPGTDREKSDVDDGAVDQITSSGRAEAATFKQAAAQQVEDSEVAVAAIPLEPDEESATAEAGEAATQQESASAEEQAAVEQETAKEAERAASAEKEKKAEEAGAKAATGQAATQEQKTAPAAAGQATPEKGATGGKTAPAGGGRREAKPATKEQIAEVMDIDAALAALNEAAATPPERLSAEGEADAQSEAPAAGAAGAPADAAPAASEAPAVEGAAEAPTGDAPTASEAPAAEGAAEAPTGDAPTASEAPAAEGAAEAPMGDVSAASEASTAEGATEAPTGDVSSASEAPATEGAAEAPTGDVSAASEAPAAEGAAAPQADAAAGSAVEAEADRPRVELVEEYLAPTRARMEESAAALAEQKAETVATLEERVTETQAHAEEQRGAAEQSAQQVRQGVEESNLQDQLPPELEQMPGEATGGASGEVDQATTPPAQTGSEKVGSSLDSEAGKAPKIEDIDPEDAKKLDKRSPSWRDSLANSQASGTAGANPQGDVGAAEMDTGRADAAGTDARSGIESRTVQAKLEVSHPDDAYEQEADRVADAVMQAPGPQSARGERQEATSQLPQVHHRTQPKVQRFFNILKWIKKLLKLLLKFINIEELQLEIKSILRSLKLKLQEIAESIKLKIETAIKNLKLKIETVIKSNLAKLDSLLKGTLLENLSLTEATEQQAESAEKAQELAEEAEAKIEETEQEAEAKSSEVQSESEEKSAEIEGEAETKGTELAEQTAKTEGEMQEDMESLSGETEQKSEELQTETEAQVDDLRGESESEASEIQAEWQSLEQDAEAQSAELQTEAETRTTEAEDRLEQLKEEQQETNYEDAQGIRDRTFAFKEEIEAQWQDFEDNSVQPALDGLKERWETLQSRAQETWTTLQTRATDIVIETKAKVTETWDVLNTKWTDLKTKSTTALNDLKSKATETWNNLKSKATEAWKNLKGKVTEAWKNLKGKVTEAWKNLKGKVTEAWKNLKSKVTESLDNLKGMATDLTGQFQNLATDALGSLKDMAKQALDNLKQQALQAAMKQIAKATGLFAVQTADAAVSTVTSTAKSVPPTPFFPGQVFVSLASLAKTIKTTFGDLIKSAAKALKDLKEKATKFWNNLKKVGDQLKAKLKGVIDKSLGKLKEMGTNALNNLKEMGTKAWNDLKSLGTEAWNNLKSLGTQAWNNLKSIGTEAWNKLKSIGTEAWNKLKDLGQNLQNLAKQTWGTVQNTWSTLKGKTTVVLNKVEGWTNDISDKVKTLAQTVQTTIQNNWTALQQRLTQLMPNLEQIWQGAKAKVDEFMAWVEEMLAQLPDALADAEAEQQAAQDAQSEAQGESERLSGEAAAAEEAALAAEQQLAESRAQGAIDDQAEQDRQAETEQTTQEGEAESTAQQETASQEVEQATEESSSGEFESAEAEADQIVEEDIPESAEQAAGEAAAQGGAGGGGDWNLEGAAEEAAATVEQARSAAESSANETPKTRETDPDFQKKEEALTAIAKEQKTHPEAKGEAAEGQLASVPSDKEKTGDAAAKRTHETEKVEPPKFNVDDFVKQLEQRIEVPESAKQLEKDIEQGKMQGVKDKMQETVKQGGEASTGELKQKTTDPLDPSQVEERKHEELVETDPGQTPQKPEGTGGVPHARSAGEIEKEDQTSLEALKKQKADTLDRIERPARDTQPEFQDAEKLEEQAQQDAPKSAEQFRKDEKQQLEETGKQVDQDVQKHVDDAYKIRTEGLKQSDQQQVETKSEDEKAREKVAADIQAIYDKTKSKVEEKLAKLDEEVNKAFDEGAQAAARAFEDTVGAKMKAYKKKRYGGALGWLKKGKDWLFGMPDEVNAFYQEARQEYLAQMKAVIRRVASIICETLNEAMKDIVKGKQDIQEYVDQLPEDLKKVGQQAADRIQSKFDQLEQDVNNKHTELINSLAQKYTESVKKIDDRIKEMKEANRGLVDKALDAIGGVIKTLIELKNMLLEVLSRAAGAIMTILANPIKFVSNLISAVGKGLKQFVTNIGNHLKKGFIEWLTGTLSGAGIQLPETWDLKGIFTLVLQVLGLTWDNIRSRAAGIFGDKVVSLLETGFEIFVIIKEQGLAGLWDWVKDKLSDLKEQVFEGIKEMLITEVIEAGIQWLIGVLGGPVGAFIKAAKAIYDIIMWFIDNAQRLAALVNSIIDSVVAIAAGNLSSAADAVENALSNFVPTAIGLLASLLGLGDLSKKVRKIIDKIQSPINNAIDKVLEMVKGFVMKIAKMLGFGGDGKEGGEIGKEVTFDAGEESHKLWVDAQGAQATLMLASEPKTVEAQLANWESRLGHLVDEKKSRAQGLIEQARSMHSEADQNADTLAQKKQEVKKLEDGDAIEQAQSSLETKEDSLASVLQQLFDLFENAGVEKWNQATTAIQEDIKKVFSNEELDKSVADWRTQYEFQSLRADVVGDEWVIVGAMDEEIMVALGAGGEKEVTRIAIPGTRNNPFDLDWPKPASSDYPVLYFGGKTKQVLSQSDLESRQGEEVEGHPVRAYEPHDGGTLPGGETIGISSQYHIAVGTVVGPLSDESTPGGGKINKILRKYGFSPNEEKMDGDHVWEIQFGGQDVIENLWPLDLSTNRSAGPTLAGTSVAHPTSGEMVRISELKQSSNEYYFKISKTS